MIRLRLLGFSAPFALMLAAVAGFVVASCEADLDTGCKDGECGEGLNDNVCDAGCDADKTHGMPCEVYKIVAGVCQDCHKVGGIGPFPLRSYDDMQCIFPMGGELHVWEKMSAAVQKDPEPVIKMPQNAWPLPDACIDTLNAWFATCEAGECAHGEGNAEDGSGGADVAWCDEGAGGG